jgi:hypothetical protein
MNAARARKTLTLAASAALACLLLLPAPVLAAKGLGKGDARKLIATLSVFELNSGAVTVKEIRTTETEATVVASVRSAFRFTRDGGRWRIAEMRIGDRQWEDFDLIPALGRPERIARARAALNALAAELVELAAARKRAGKGGADKDAGGEDAKEAPAGDDQPLVRGPVRVEKPASAFSALGASAVLEAEVEASFDFVRERGRWRVARAHVAGETFDEFDAFTRALDQLKTVRARTDLDALASALEAYRRERGFYAAVVTGSALNDHLSPRYLRAPVRFDPWHRPYEYEGTPAAYVLRSNGPDGKPNTADDVTVRK